MQTRRKTEFICPIERLLLHAPIARDFMFNSQNVKTGFSKKLKKKVIVYNDKSQSARLDEFCENY